VHPSSFLVARLVLTALLIGSQAYLLFKIVHYLNARQSRMSIRLAVWVTFVIFNIPIFYLITFRPPKFLFADFFTNVAVFPFYVWQFSGLIIFLLQMLGKVIRLPFVGTVALAKWIPITRNRVSTLQGNERFKRFDRSRRMFLRTAFWGASAYVVVGSSYGALYRNRFEVVRKELKLTNLPSSLKGLTLGLVSDIHAGPYMSKEEIDRYVVELNSLRPDIIFLPGDFVTIRLDEIYPVIESVSELKAPYGVFGCLGNHEFYSRAPDEITRRLNDAGVKMLRNENALLDIRGAKLAILGIDDLGHGDDFPAAIRGVPPDMTKILMSHKPYFFPTAAESGVDLTLAGHTHGGQVVFVKVGDFTLAPATLASKYVAGLYDIGDSQMYVSRGVGTIGVPFRINCPPEVTLFTLT
jgi:predicted MPP superfamily phosphohydrolase